MSTDVTSLDAVSLLEWYHELIEDGASKLWVDREVFDALCADKRITWTPKRPQWDSVGPGEQIAHVNGVPLYKG